MKKYMTQWQEEEFTEEQIGALRKKAERYHKGTYESHRIVEQFNDNLGINQWFLEVTVLKKRKSTKNRSLDGNF